MSDQPENFILIYLRRMDEKLDRVLAELQDLKLRVTILEESNARIRLDLAELGLRVARHEVRFDRIDQRLDRIERRLDLVDTHA